MSEHSFISSLVLGECAVSYMGMFQIMLLPHSGCQKIHKMYTSNVEIMYILFHY